MAIYSILFLFGLLLGSTLCNLTCGPLVVFRIGGYGKGWKRGLLLSLYFSAARMFVLVVLGVILGGAGYGASRVLDTGPLIWFSPSVYLILGVFSIFNGLYFLGLLKKGQTSCTAHSAGGLTTRLVMRMLPGSARSERATMIGIGLLMSVVCFGEGWVILLGAAPIAGSSATSLIQGSLLGGLAMLFFSAGLSIPLISISTLASEAGKRYDLTGLLRVGGIILLLIGLYLVIFETYTLIMLIS